MSLSEQALFLLDIFPSIQKRKKLERFHDLDQTIEQSLYEKPYTEKVEIRAEKPVTYNLASKWAKANYEDQAKADALTHALQQIRAKHASKPRSKIIRGS